MCKTLIILILLFDGTLVKEEYPLARPMEVHECLMFADDHREAIATYKEFEDSMKNVGVNMIWSMLIIIGIYAVIVGMLIMWNNEPITRGKK
jgi:hypothetical protein